MLIKFSKVEEATKDTPKNKEKVYPKPCNANSEPSEFDRIKSNIEYRLYHYDFYPEFFKGYQCYPECMLLFDAFSSYLETFCPEKDQTPDSIIMLAVCDLSVTDRLLKKAAKESPDAQCIKAYQTFKRASPTRQKDAIALLYQYFTFERYLLKREDAYV